MSITWSNGRPGSFLICFSRFGETGIFPCSRQVSGTRGSREEIIAVLPSFSRLAPGPFVESCAENDTEYIDAMD